MLALATATKKLPLVSAPLQALALEVSWMQGKGSRQAGRLTLVPCILHGYDKHLAAETSTWA